MPEESKIDVGDTEEDAVDVNIAPEDPPPNPPVSDPEDSGSDDELEEYSAGVNQAL